MAAKTIGLAAFTQKNAPKQDTAPEQATTVRRRGQGATVALTIRLARADWERLHQLAVAEGVSLQALTLQGLSKIFSGKGLPGINS